MYHEIINDTFDAFGKVPITSLSLPYVSHAKGTRVRQYPMKEVIFDYITEDKPLEALIIALEKSNCQLVKNIKDSLKNRYIHMHEDELNLVSEGGF